MPNILLTGFTPFGEFQSNPSQEIAERLNGETIGGANVIGLTLPVTFGDDFERLSAAIADFKPALVLSLGLAAGAACLEVERFAVNLRDTEDRSDSQRCIAADGMAGLFVTIDAERVAAAIREQAGVPARAHGYAGSYLCNHLLYQTLHCALQWDLSYCAGFIHLPISSEQAIVENKLHLPSLPLDSMARGIRAAIEEALK